MGGDTPWPRLFHRFDVPSGQGIFSSSLKTYNRRTICGRRVQAIDSIIVVVEGWERAAQSTSRRLTAGHRRSVLAVRRSTAGLCVCMAVACGGAPDDLSTVDAANSIDALAPGFDAPAPVSDAPVLAVDAPMSSIDAGPVDAVLPDDAPLGGPVPDASDVVIVAGSYVVSPDYFDVVLDHERHRVFLSYKTSGTVEAVSLVDGSVDVIDTGYDARHLHFDPVIDRVLVSLRTTPAGYLGFIDTTTLADPPVWLVPWLVGDSTSDGSGVAYVLSADGHNGVTLDLSNGGWNQTGEPSSTRLIDMHPSLNKFYGSTSTQLQRFDVVGDGFSFAYSSDPIAVEPCERFKIRPPGDLIYMECGNFLHATDTFATDMSAAGFIGPPWLDIAFDPGADRIFTVADGATAGMMNVYDGTTHLPLPPVTVSYPAQRILTGPDYLVFIMDIPGPATRVEVVPLSAL